MNTTKKAQALQGAYLNAIRKEHIIVEVFLVNGVRLLGMIDSFDPYVILLKNAKSNVTQMVYKHAISTIQPSRPINLPISTEQDLDDDTENQGNV